MKPTINELKERIQEERRKGNLEKALEHCAEGIELAPDDCVLYLFQSQIHYDKDDISESIKSIHKAIKRCDHDANQGISKDIFNAKIKAYEAKIDSIKAGGLEKKDNQHEHMHCIVEIIMAYEVLIGYETGLSEKNDNLIKLYVQRATKYHDAQLLNEAMDDYKTIINLTGSANIKEDNVGDALTALKGLCKIYKLFGYRESRRGEVDESEESYKSADEYYEQAIANCKPGSNEYFRCKLMRTNSLMVRGNYDYALNEVQNAKEERGFSEAEKKLQEINFLYEREFFYCFY